MPVYRKSHLLIAAAVGAWRVGVDGGERHVEELLVHLGRHHVDLLTVRTQELGLQS